MGISMQGDSSGMLSGSQLGREKKGSRILGEKSWTAMQSPSADTPGSSGAEIILQSCPA